MEDVLLRPGLAWLQRACTSFRCAPLNTDVDPRTRDESLRLAVGRTDFFVFFVYSMWAV